jgi:outer membrane protein OmpA-like peptidoglycan-associated protein
MTHYGDTLMKKLSLGALLLAPALAAGQTNVNAEFLRPTPGNNYLGARDAQILAHALLRFEALFNFADDPAIVIEQQNDQTINETKIVDSQSAVDLMAAFGIKNILEFGVALPVALFQNGETLNGINTSAVQSGKLGDIRLSAKARLIGDSERTDGFFLSFTPELTLPTGSGEDFFGAASASGLIALTGTWVSDRLALSASAGPRFQQDVAIANLAIGDSLETQFAIAYRATEKIRLMAETDGAFSLEGGALESGQLPLEFRGGAHIKVAPNVIIPVGFGAGLVDGLGSPDFRVLAGVIFAPSKDKTTIDLDPDKDGILGEADMCPNEPEDKDNFEDTDGCIEDNDKDGIADVNDDCIDVPGVAEFKGCPDSDGDKIVDSSDKCPTVPGIAEFGGCPDTDGDKIVDSDDKCPKEPGIPELQGCPELDKDKDGIADKNDKCPKDPEDKDNFEDEDGCPEDDNDKDKVVDKDDLCPTEQEDGKGKAPKDGCPDEVKATIVGGQLFILDKVFFDVNKDTIKKGNSFVVLDSVVAVLKEHPEVKKVRVEGHTDDQGKDESNLDLSKRRAKRVMDYLIKQGIEADRLESEGYGESAPLVPFAELDPKKQKKELNAARDKNRRVQFTILDPKPTTTP